MKMSWKREILALALLAAMAVIAVHYYSILPGRIPGYLDAHGRPREWSSKNMFFFMWGVYLIVPYLMITFLPFIDPLRQKIESRFKTFLLVRDALLVTFALFFVVSLMTAVKGEPRIYWLGVAVGIFLIIYANYLPKIPRNFSIGMKTRWALSSEIVWKKTQIFSGWLFAATGIMFIVFALTGLNAAIPGLAIIPVMVIIEVYSYLVYKRGNRANVGRGQSLLR